MLKVVAVIYWEGGGAANCIARDKATAHDSFKCHAKRHLTNVKQKLSGQPAKVTMQSSRLPGNAQLSVSSYKQQEVCAAISSRCNLVRLENNRPDGNHCREKRSKRSSDQRAHLSSAASQQAL